MRESLFELKNKDDGYQTIVGVGDLALNAGKIASSFGGGVIVDSIIKSVLNTAGVKFVPSRICARIFGITVAKPYIKKAVKNTYKEYEESYIKFQKELMIKVKEEEEKEDGTEVQ